MKSIAVKLVAMAVMATTLSGCIVYVEDKVDTTVTHKHDKPAPKAEKSSF